MTEEQKVKLEENKKHQEEQRQRELNIELEKIAMMTGMVAGLYSRTNKDKYHVVYDELGFPNI